MPNDLEQNIVCFLRKNFPGMRPRISVTPPPQHYPAWDPAAGASSPHRRHTLSRLRNTACPCYVCGYITVAWHPHPLPREGGQCVAWVKQLDHAPPTCCADATLRRGYTGARSQCCGDATGDDRRWHAACVCSCKWCAGTLLVATTHGTCHLVPRHTPGVEWCDTYHPRSAGARVDQPSPCPPLQSSGR